VGQRRDSSAKLIDVIGDVLLHGANLDIPRRTSRWLSGGLQGKDFHRVDRVCQAPVAAPCGDRAGQLTTQNAKEPKAATVGGPRPSQPRNWMSLTSQIRPSRISPSRIKRLDLEYATGECVPVMAVFGMTEEHLSYAH
jgi:hypothetical protein